MCSRRWVIYNCVMVTEILRPQSVQEALKARSLPHCAYLGGGTWLNASRSETPVTLISLEKLGLQGIAADQGRCVIGASATLQQVVDHGGVPEAVRSASALTASRTLRNMITIGGELALHPADSALVPVLLALGAQLSVAGRKKPVSLHAFLSDRSFAGTSLVLSVSIPEPRRKAAVRAVSRTSHSSRSLVVAASAEALQPVVVDLRLIVSDCRGSILRLTKLEAALAGQPLPPRSDVEAAAEAELPQQADIHASSQYKAYMTRVLAADVLREMAGGKGVV